MSDYKTNVIQGQENLDLKLRSWTCRKPIADILFCHGFQEYAGRYDNEASFFNEAGINFFSFDQRTHGESGGKYRSYIDSFDNYVKDLDLVKRHFNLGNERPLFLMGHSMGAAVIFKYVLKLKDRGQIKGVLFSAPLLKSDENMAPLLQKMSGFIGRLLPKLKTIKLDTSAISSDPEQVKIYESDALIYKKGIYAKSGAELLQELEKLQEQFKAFDLPFIIQHSKSDKLTSFKGSQWLYEQSPSNDKSLIPLEDLGHEIMKDRTSTEVLKRFKDWILNRI